MASIEKLWHGTDADKTISLYEYGFLCRKKGEIYEVVYFYNNDIFISDTISVSDINEFISDRTEEEIQQFLDSLGSDYTLEMWLNYSVVSKLSDIYSYYGFTELFGYSGERLTEKEACKKVAIKYQESL